MAYRVDVSKNAETELEELYLWVVGRAPQQGAKWFNGLERVILALDHHPERCPVAPESFDPDHPVRVLSYGRRPHVYRIFFTVDHTTKVVRVVHVRRGARQRPMVDELKEKSMVAPLYFTERGAGPPLLLVHGLMIARTSASFFDAASGDFCGENRHGFLREV